MAWDRKTASYWAFDSDTGEWDTATHTVKFQPADQSYPTGAVNGEQLTCLYVWVPVSDLDEMKHYDVYVDGTKKDRLISPNSEPPVSAGA